MVVVWSCLVVVNCGKWDPVAVACNAVGSGYNVLGMVTAAPVVRSVCVAARSWFIGERASPLPNKPHNAKWLVGCWLGRRRVMLLKLVVGRLRMVTWVPDLT